MEDSYNPNGWEKLPIQRMTSMFDFGPTERAYWDRKNWASLESYKEALKVSTTLYIGNLSFYTQESQIYALFDQVRLA